MLDVTGSSVRDAARVTRAVALRRIGLSPLARVTVAAARSTPATAVAVWRAALLTSVLLALPVARVAVSVTVRTTAPAELAELFVGELVCGTGCALEEVSEEG
jgi:hypothetical protein